MLRDKGLSSASIVSPTANPAEGYEMGVAWLWIGLLVLLTAAAVWDYRHRVARRLARSRDQGILTATQREVERAQHKRLTDDGTSPGGFVV